MSYLDSLPKLTTIADWIDPRLEKKEEEEQESTTLGHIWTASCSLATEAVRIAVPVAIAYGVGCLTGHKLGDNEMTAILAMGTAVGISPEIAAARKMTTDLALDGAAKAAALGANKTREIAADRLRMYSENQNSKQV